MNQSGVILVTTEAGYFLRLGEEESEVAEYGQPLEAILGGFRYVAFMDLEEDTEDFVSNLDYFVYRAEPQENVQVEEEFVAGEEEEEDEEGEESGDDDDNDEDDDNEEGSGEDAEEAEDGDHKDQKSEDKQ